MHWANALIPKRLQGAKLMSTVSNLRRLRCSESLNAGPWSGGVTSLNAFPFFVRMEDVMKVSWNRCLTGVGVAAAALVVLASCGDRPAQPGTASKAAAPAASAPALQPQAWGPIETKRGQAVNKQPDGVSAIWIRVSGVAADPATKVKFGDRHASPATVTSELVTAAIPQVVIDTAGDYPVVIEEPSGRRTPVGTFRVVP